MSKIVVEICCGSAEDVFRAKAAGADRAELNSAVFLGGLTPTIGTVKAAAAAGLPLMCMLRPRQGGFCYSDTEYEVMLTDARLMLDAGAAGIVFGFLHEDGSVDIEKCRGMTEVIGDRESVFHRAIDVVPDWHKAIDQLSDLGLTRILTSGQQPSVHYGADTVKQMIEYAAGRIEILPGAGVNLLNAADIIARTGADQIHAGMSGSKTDSSAAANPSIHFGSPVYPAENVYPVSDEEKIRGLVRQLSIHNS